MFSGSSALSNQCCSFQSCKWTDSFQSISTWKGAGVGRNHKYPQRRNTRHQANIEQFHAVCSLLKLLQWSKCSWLYRGAILQSLRCLWPDPTRPQPSPAMHIPARLDQNTGSAVQVYMISRTDPKTCELTKAAARLAEPIISFSNSWIIRSASPWLSERSVLWIDGPIKDRVQGSSSGIGRNK